jgi:hypothetical protein
VADPRALAALTQVDWIFLAADTNTARHVTNAVIQQHPVPGIQVGVSVPVATDGQIGEVHVAIRPLLPGVACQWCQELIDPSELALEAQGRGRPGRAHALPPAPGNATAKAPRAEPAAGGAHPPPVPSSRSVTPATYCPAPISTVAESHSICSVFGLYRTPNTSYPMRMVSGEWDTTEIFAELVEDLGLHLVEDGQLDRPDLVFLDAGGRRVLVELKRLSTPSPTQVSRLIADAERGSRPDALHVLVADRIPEAVRAELRSRGWGWLDLRGHLHLTGHGVFVDADLPRVKGRAERADAFSGPAGLEVACSLLLEPDMPHGVRDLARSLGRSPSTVSDVLATLRRQGLVGADGVAVLPNLFWETASAWRPIEVPLMDLPRPGTGSVNAALRLGFDEIEAQPGWALTGTLAAAIYGAPIAARSDHPPDFYVPSQAVLRRATRLLGVAADADFRRSSVRVAPVPAVCEQRVGPPGQQAKTWASTNEPWPLAKPLFVALDLARDPGRGREILEGWQPPQPWRRVW